MVVEFHRYRVPRLRVLTGLLQIAGSFGLIAGYSFRPLLLCASAGFTIMMVAAVLTRVRIRDPWYAAIPAFSLCVLNAFIFAMAL